MSALSSIRKHFPQVTKIVDARIGITIKVTEKDNKKARKKDPNNCALATACIDSHIADSAIIGISSYYLIKGNKAVRYKTTESVSREITSFDRHHDFQPGIYGLSPVSKSCRLGAHRLDHTGPKNQVRKIIHKNTANIRRLSK